jgi:hypothetical protein
MTEVAARLAPDRVTRPKVALPWDGNAYPLLKITVLVHLATYVGLGKAELTAALVTGEAAPIVVALAAVLAAVGTLPIRHFALFADVVAAPAGDPVAVLPTAAAIFTGFANVISAIRFVRYGIHCWKHEQHCCQED